MKKYIFLTGFLFPVFLYAQNQEPEAIARLFATRMKDSLALSAQQATFIYNINMQLNHAKMQARQSFTQMDSLRRQIQKIENTRDSLYSTVLDTAQYRRYREKKNSLIRIQ